MCGLAGIFNFRGPERLVDRTELARISARMLTRGPDASGSWFSSRGDVALAHRRLSVIDLHVAANQPLAFHGGDLCIVFNGEIYNYRELRRELERCGHQFRTDSDTEVLLQAYAQWDEAALQRLRGMYAFAIWDDRKKQLFLARDPYGIKPLYFSSDGKTFRFASQVKALLEGGRVSSAVDPAGLTGFLMMGSVPEPHSLYKYISPLPAGCHMTVSGKGVGEPRRHFSVSDVWRNAAENPRSCDPGELQARVAEAVGDSVEHHMVADVPVGLFLSAGVDSGSLAALIAERREAGIPSITLGFSDFGGSDEDETTLAGEVAARYGCAHTVHWITEKDIEQDLPAILDSMDQPSVDGINTWLVSKAARAAGLKVVISGLGGDELFGGYSHFDTLQRWRTRLVYLHRVPGASVLGASALSWLAKYGLVNPKARALLCYGATYPALYFAKRGLFMPWELAALIGEEMAVAGLDQLRPPDFVAESVRPEPLNGYAAVAALEASFYLRNQLLRDADWASMAHSLELRTPLVDATLLALLAPLLVKRVPGMKGKVPLANSPARPLPASVVGRAKTGFSLPLDRWLESSKVLDGWRAVPALSGRRVHWSRRLAWTLVDKLL